MAATPSPLVRLLVEMRRRHFFRVVIAYSIGAWFVLQIASVILPPLMIPAWVMTVLVVVALAGLPIVAILAWVYDITAEGIVRTEPLDEGEAVPLRWNWRWVDFAIIAALLGVVAFVLVRPSGEPAPTDTPAIAVLPFADLSPARDTSYFSDGVAEAVMDGLAQLPGLRVAARSSSFSFRGSDLDIREVAETLGVGTVLEGSVRKSGEQVRVSARLVDGRSGHNLWSETFDGDLADIFTVQDRIARAVVQVLRVRLLGDGTLVGTATEDPLAYDHYLRGRNELRAQATLETIETAIEQFQQALARDPGFGLARAGLCTAYWQRYDVTRDTGLVTPAIEACGEALSAAPTRPETHVALGHLYRGTGQREPAEAAFRHALALDASNAEAWAGLGSVLQGQAAERALLRAIDLDPAFWRYHSYLGAHYFGQARYERAVEYFNRALRLDPEAPRAQANLGAALFYAGEFDQAAVMFELALEHRPSAQAYSNMGSLHFYRKDYAAAARMFEQAVALSPNHPSFRGHLAETLYRLDGHRDAAQAQLEHAIELAEAQLEVNPADHDTRALLALYLARAGRPTDAGELAARLDAVPEPGMYALRNLAEMHLVLGDEQRASRLFEQAVDRGWPAALTLDLARR